MRALEIAAAGPYNVFFLLALAIGFAIAWRQGRRLGLMHAEWLAVLALTAAAGLVGARLLHFDATATLGAKTIVGGVMLAALTLFGGSRFLRIDPRSADALALALPLGFAVGRIGCLLAGCCFGHPTDLPWGALYDAQSAAFRAQLDAGLISADASVALPVHPTQLYEATLALFVAAGVPRMRRALRRPGSLLLAVLVALAIGRIVLEFFRARDIPTFVGLTQVQLLIAVAACITALLLFLRERPADVQPAVVRVHSTHVLRVAIAASVAPLLLLGGGAFFSPLERLALALVALPPLLALIGPLVAATTRGRHALATPAAIPCALLLLALQQAPEPARPQTASESAYPRSEWSLGIGFAANKDLEQRVVGTDVDDCGNIHDVMAPFELRSRVGGAVLSHTTRSEPGRGRTIRLRGFAGTERARRNEDAAQPVTTTTLGGVGASLTLDYMWFGVTAGGAIGQFSGNPERSSLRGTAAVRAGRFDGLHAFAGVNDTEPLGHSESVFRAGVGYGFANGSALRGGLWNGDRPFLGGTLAVRQFELEPSVAFGDEYDVRVSLTRRFPVSR